MKTICALFFCWLAFHPISAQEISLDQINSSNILEYYKSIQPQPVLDEYKKMTLTSQIGNGNIMEIFDRAPNYMVLSQMGNYNTTIFVNPNSYPTNAEITIKGSGNYIDITGSNSISEGMRININANDMTIFMRNY